MMIFTYMTIRGVPGTWQTTVTGLLLLAAMVGGRLLQRNGGGDVALGEAFRDDFAAMSKAGAAMARGSMAAATLPRLIVIFAADQPALPDGPQPHRLWSSRTPRWRSSRSAR